MDQWTRRHLEAWADHVLADDERETVLARMREVYRQDPERYDAAGWNTLRRDAEVA